MKTSVKVGATRQSWSDNNPRAVLRRVIQYQPDGSEADHLQAFRYNAKNDDGVIDAIIDYWFTNNYRSMGVIKLGENQTAVFNVVRRERRKDTRERVEKLKTEIRAVLFDHVLVCGKKLRHATFGECLSEGGWLTGVGKQGPANQVVGKKLTEEDLRGLYRRFHEDVRFAKEA